MSLDALKPFLKIGGVVLGLALLGLVATCSLGKSGSPTEACNALKMDRINTCVERMRACGGDEDVAKACQKKVLRDLE